MAVFRSTRCNDCWAEASKGYLSAEIPAQSPINYQMVLSLNPEPDRVASGTLLLTGYDVWADLTNFTLQGRAHTINATDTWHLYNSQTVKFYYIRNGYARILANTVPGGLWLRLEQSSSGYDIVLKLRPVAWNPRLGGTFWRISGYTATG